MEENNTIYELKSKHTDVCLVFEYNMQGALKSFKIFGELSLEQRKWLFSLGECFPSSIEMFQKIKPIFKKGFIIKLIPCDISFEALWKAYKYKVGKKDAEKAYKKLKEEDIIRVFNSLPSYETYLKRTGIAKAYLATYINKEYYNNEY